MDDRTEATICERVAGTLRCSSLQLPPRAPPTQPSLLLKKGWLGTMTHDYSRNGTTTLFTALSVLNGIAIGRNIQRHRH